MKKLINRVEDVLNEQLQGLAKAHPQLTLHQDPLYVTRTDAPVAGKVALLSGGGSGHEPMHCWSAPPPSAATRWKPALNWAAA